MMKKNLLRHSKNHRSVEYLTSWPGKLETPEPEAHCVQQVEQSSELGYGRDVEGQEIPASELSIDEVPGVPQRQAPKRKRDRTIFEAFGELSKLSRGVQKIKEDVLNAADQFGLGLGEDQKK